MTILGISGVAGSGKSTFANVFHTREWVSVSLADPIKRIAADLFGFTDDQLWGPSASRNGPDSRYPRDHTWVTDERTEECRCACCGAHTVLYSVEDDVRIPDERSGDDGGPFPPCYLTPRFVLQRIGTEVGRACYPTVWIDKAVAIADSLLAAKRFGAPTIRYTDVHGPFKTHRYPPVQGVCIPDVRFWNEVQELKKRGVVLVRVCREGAGLGGAQAQHPSEQEQLSIPDDQFHFVVENNGSVADLERKAVTLHDHLAAFFPTTDPLPHGFKVI